MELKSKNLPTILVCLVSLFLDMTQASLIKRIKASREKAAAASASTNQNSYTPGMHNQGYGQGYGHHNPQHSPGQGNRNYGNYYDGHEYSPPNNYRDGGPYHEAYIGEPSHNPGRYATPAGPDRYYPGPQNSGDGNHFRDPDFRPSPIDPPNSFEDYGYSEDHSNAYGIVHPNDHNANNGPNRVQQRPNIHDNEHSQPPPRRYNDYDDYYDDYNNNYEQSPIRPNSCPGPRCNPGQNSQIPEVIITEKKPLSLDDLEKGSSSNNGGISSYNNNHNPNSGLIQKIKNWRNSDKQSGKSENNPIR